MRGQHQPAALSDPTDMMGSQGSHGKSWNGRNKMTIPLIAAYEIRVISWQSKHRGKSHKSRYDYNFFKQVKKIKQTFFTSSI